MKRLGVYVLITLALLSIFHDFSPAKGEGWDYAKEHVIIGSPSGSQVDYQIRLIVHYGLGDDLGEDVYCDSKCRGDFGDIRFTDSNGNLLSYWIEDKTDFDRAKIWVKVPFIPAYPNTTKISVHYGNMSATTTSSGEDTFIFFDDFEQDIVGEHPSKWGVFEETSNGVRVSNITSRNGMKSVKIYSEYGKADSMYINLEPMAQYSLHYSLLQSLYGSSGVGSGFNHDNGTWPYGTQAIWMAITNNDLQYYDTTYHKIIDVALNIWYDVEVRVNTNIDDFDCYVNGILKQVNCSFRNDVDHISCIYSTSWTDQPAWSTHLDIIYVRKLCDPEPTHGETIPLFQKIIVDKVHIREVTAYLGEAQTVSFHAKWDNGSDVVSGYLLINETSYVTNSTGWATVIYEASSVGIKTWKVTGVDVYGNSYYEQIIDDPHVTFFDRIKADYYVESLVPGSFQVTVSLKSEYSNVPINDAALTMNGIESENLGNGMYQVRVDSWLPLLTITLHAEKEFFDPINISTNTFAVGNIILASSVIILGVVAVFRFNTQRIKRNKQSHNLNELEKLVKEKGQIRLNEAADRLGLDLAEVKTLLHNLIKDRRVEGTFTLDGLSFILEDKLTEEILKGIE